MDGLSNQGRVSRRHWNRIPDAVRSLVVEVALDRPELTPRGLAWHITDTHDYFLSTVLDDYSRYIITWRLTTTMATADVTDTLEDALKATACPKPGYGTSPACCRTMGLATSVANSNPGSKSRR